MELKIGDIVKYNNDYFDILEHTKLDYLYKFEILKINESGVLRIINIDNKKIIIIHSDYIEFDYVEMRKRKLKKLIMVC